MSPTCPRCGKDDMVRKATSIIDSETISGSYLGPAGTVSYHDGEFHYGATLVGGKINTKSQLAERLSFREPPPKSGFPDIFYFGLFFFIVPGGFWLLDTSISENSYCKSVFLILIITGIIFIVLGFFAKLGRDRNYEEQIKTWREANSSIMKHKYYCYRCDEEFFGF